MPNRRRSPATATPTFGMSSSRATSVRATVVSLRFIFLTCVGAERIPNHFANERRREKPPPSWKVVFRMGCEIEHRRVYEVGRVGYELLWRQLHVLVGQLHQLAQLVGGNRADVSRHGILEAFSFC